MAKRNVKMAPSILSADFARLGEEVQAITKAGADYIHIDVMDGHFVPNLTLGPPVIRAMRPHTDLTFDVHLMIKPVDHFIADFISAGAEIITVHAEATTHLQRTLQLIRSFGAQRGVSIVPTTPESVLQYVIDEVDLILVMTVNPGFGGQEFLRSQLQKIRAIREMIDRSGREIDLEVDGGINVKTAADVLEAGADVLVAGSAVFTGNAADYAANIKALRHAKK